MTVVRHPNNPIITPADIRPIRDDFEVIGVFNGAVTRFGNEVILLVRVAERPVSPNPDNTELTAVYDVTTGGIAIKEFSKDNATIDFSDPRMTITPFGKFLTSLSHLRVARSKDGINFDVEDGPALFPANDYESFSIEDPRITFIEGTYYITYVAVSDIGVTTSLASTKDFKIFERYGVIFGPDNKDVVIFPEKINDRYYALHRPVTPLFEKYHMWIAESPDMVCWGNHHYLMGGRQEHWDSARVGGGAVPFRIEQGWMELYHGADQANRYCMGAVLLDSKEPWKIIARSEKPVLEPKADYELEGFFGNVVFSCGLLYEEDKLKIYYGVSDTSIAYAELPLEDVIRNLSYY